MQHPLRTVSKGSAANVAGQIAIQTTVNANGEITVDRSEFVFDVCGG